MLRDFSKDVFDIIIQAGQSNAEGSGLGPAAPYEPKENVWSLSGDFTISRACERVSGDQPCGNFVLRFADKYLEDGLLAPGRQLLIILSAVGGTGFSDNRWKAGEDLRVRALELTKTALELNPANKVVALLWHQGETDASLNASYDYYTANFASLLSEFRAAARESALPFVAGDFVKGWKSENLAACELVVKALRDACARDGRGGFVETADLPSNDDAIGNSDNIHFSRAGLNTLGERYFEAWRTLMA